MAQIDKFIEALHKYKAQTLEVAANAQIMLGVNGARRTATSQAVSSDQVDRLLSEIMPSEPGSLSDSPDGKQFSYNAPTGPVRVAFTRDDGTLRLLISPDNGSAAARDTSAAAGVTSVGADSRARQRMEALLTLMVEEGCSDLHLSTGSPPLYRKDGEIVPLGDETPMDAEQAREVLLSITPPHRLEEFDKSNDSDFAYEIPDVARFRCNLFMDRKGMGGVFRFIPAEIMTVHDLGLSEEIINLCNLHKGLVVVTGPTGSGKSTTLAAMVDHINTNRTDHIITIEDPIEFVHPNKKCLVNQREVGVHTEGFKVALRAALREDPDVVLVGEMRDLETVEIAIETAETGHLVFGTLHTNTAASTVDRIIDQFPSAQQDQIRTMLAESLRGVLSQTLVKAKGGGRVAALEVLLINNAVSNLIREGKTYQIPSVMQTSRGTGMRTLNDALLELVKAGKVEPQDAYWKAVDKSELESLFSRNGYVLPKN
jgi:twitching motility protein PilT